ncbi:MAG: T9SS type A sorting domain-containing protein, partial [Candidatus Poribacteria bacterium]
IKVESDMSSWQPTQINVVLPKVVEVGTVIEVKANIWADLDSPPTITLRQGDTIIKTEMKGEFGEYKALLDTQNMKSGFAKVKIIAIRGEEEIIYETDINLVRSNAVESIDNCNSQTRKYNKIKNRVYPAYPNPFNPDVWIPFDIEEGGNVTIEIYNVFGQHVRTLELGYKMPGRYVSANKAGYWDGRNSHGEEVSSGIYFYRLKSGNFSAIGKMIAVK